MNKFDTIWNARFEEFKLFVNTKCRLPLSKRHDATETSLFGWMRFQFRCDKNGTLLPNRKEALQALPCFKESFTAEAAKDYLAKQLAERTKKVEKAKTSTALKDMKPLSEAVITLLAKRGLTHVEDLQSLLMHVDRHTLFTASALKVVEAVYLSDIYSVDYNYAVFIREVYADLNIKSIAFQVTKWEGIADRIYESLDSLRTSDRAKISMAQVLAETFEGKTINEIAVEYELSASRVRELFAKGVRSMRHPSRLLYIRGARETPFKLQ